MTASIMERKSFAKIDDCIDIPNLVEIQVRSYEQFLKSGGKNNVHKKDIGLESTFQETFPIESFDGGCRLEYVGYTLGIPKYSVDECRKRGMIYAAPLKVSFRLIRKGQIKEQEVYMGDLPIMTETGTFVINGAERVVVSQLHRSPGVSCESSIHTSGKRLFGVRIIPYRGAWLEFEADQSDVLYAYIDRRKKILATTLLRALGLSSNLDIFKALAEVKKVPLSKSGIKKLEGKVLAQDIFGGENNELVVASATTLSLENLEFLIGQGVTEVEIVDFVGDDKVLANTIEREPYRTTEEAQIGIFKRVRPGDPPTPESAQDLIHKFFFDPQRYDLGKVGRFMLNRKLGLRESTESPVLVLDDVVQVVAALLKLRTGERKVDDIDHLGNRRVRSVGELLQNQFRVGLARMKRSALERMSIYDLDTIMPHNLINPKLLGAAIKDFFGRSQLSQFMDQTNPLSELTHKRRLSALGPGGLSRERAGFEVRDVHPSHYGRICPIETPEGPNIGLIASLGTFAQVNDVGFVETPYRAVKNGKVTNKIDYLSADVEDNFVIAQASAPIDSNGKFVTDRISCRAKGDFAFKSPDEINYMDVSPKQLVSVAAALIPFLEHDDANRALMGSNMQRQAVPLLFPDSPVVGTGMEGRVAQDSGACLTSKTKGTVKQVGNDEIVVGDFTYKLKKFERSNAGTCINQRPLVKVGQKVKRGEVLADGFATKDGELALGQNVTVAFMPWRGYNFEDAIILSERLLKDDTYTSVHIEEFDVEARDTKLGPEEITRDIPNVSEDALSELDEDGIIRVGAEVNPRDILVGKISPKSETELSPEEKLLRAIFGEKAGDVRDASLTVPPGCNGIVVDVKVFARKESRARTKDEKKVEAKQIEQIQNYYQSRISALRKERLNRLSELVIGQKLSEPLLEEVLGEELLKEGHKLSSLDLKKLEECDWESMHLQDGAELEDQIHKIARVWGDEINTLIEEKARETDRVLKGDELQPGVIQKIVVHVASKRKISVGDKMAGRHGNKGVVSTIVPEEDMPYMADGNTIEIVLNPLGVPSRMNVGQLLETHLGWAAKKLGFKLATPIFSGATEKEITGLLTEAGLPVSGKINLRDGRTGQSFDQDVTVGTIYMLKLAHMADDKIHARSIGPYSLVTQQPLGGKAQFGGQRFGEMEVWALEAYGAAYTLQELLTVKSDDVQGRTRVYEAIVKGENAFHAGTPESFNVLVKELQSLGLDVLLEKNVAAEAREREARLGSRSTSGQSSVKEKLEAFSKA